MNKENLEKIVSETISKYEGLHVDRVLDQLRSELNDALNSYLDLNWIVKEDFPIKFENEVGAWEIHHDGTSYVHLKKATQYIECNITIKPTGDIENG